MSNKGVLVVISAPSGGGKTTLVNELASRFKNSRRSLSYTTRPPRTTEINGQDYHFVSDSEFDRLIAEQAFVEWAHVHNSRYGTTKQSLKTALDKGEVLFMTIDVQGAKNIKKHFPEALTIFMMPPDFDVLETRLRKRGTESDSDIRRRLETARKEIAVAHDFDALVLNDSLDRAVLEVEALIRRHIGL